MPHCHRTAGKSCTKAFSLVEILMVMAISSMLLLVLAKLAGTALSTWRNATAREAMHAQASAALELLSIDLAALALQGNQTVDSTDDIILQVTKQNAILDEPSHRLDFFNTPNSRNPDWTGDVCATSFSITFLPANTTDRPRLALYRSIISPETLFSSRITEEKTPLEITDEADRFLRENFLASNITNLTIRLIGLHPDGSIRIFHGDELPQVNAHGQIIIESEPDLAAYQLTSLQIQVTMVDDAGLNRLIDSPDSILSPGSRKIFTKTVSFD
jgi:prepilin-type N-terminal cleavage/methylation domain-containing protein